MHEVGRVGWIDKKNLGLCLQKELLRKGLQCYAISATPLYIQHKYQSGLNKKNVARSVNPILPSVFGSYINRGGADLRPPTKNGW